MYKTKLQNGVTVITTCKTSSLKHDIKLCAGTQEANTEVVLGLVSTLARQSYDEWNYLDVLGQSEVDIK